MKCKKLLALMLSVVMVGSTLPMAALAAESDFLAGGETTSGWVDLDDLPFEANETETASVSDETGNNTTTGDKNVPGWVDENDGHPKKVAEMFDFVENEIAYSYVEGGVEVAPWYWQWVHHDCDQGHVQAVHAGSEYSNRSISIPDTVTHNNTTYSVVGIGDNAFYNAKNYSVAMPSDSADFTYIGEGAFHQSGYGNITIPASVTTIKKDAFRSPDTNPTYTFAEGSKLQSIGDRAFRGNETITSLALPEGLKSLGSCVFSGCDALTVTIPASVDTINTDTFDEFYDADKNGNTGNVIFAEDGTFQLQDGVLYDKENLIRVLDWQESVTVPDGIKYIGDDAFSAIGDSTHSNVLSSITLPESLVSIGDEAFRECKALTTIEIPESVTEIGTSAFYGCTGLTSVTIKGPVTELNGTFNGCSSLASVQLPNTLETIGSNTFANSKITNFDFSNIREIGMNAFKGSSLTVFQGADKLETLGTNAFQQCTSLKTAVIPKGITKIPTATFAMCKSLETVVIPDTVTNFGMSAFNNAFAEAGGTLLIMDDNPPTIGQYVFNMQNTKPENLKVFYPKASESAYKQTILVGQNENNGYALDLTDASMILTSTAKATDTNANSNTLTLKTVTVPEGMTLTAASDTENVATVAVSEGNLVVTGVAEGTATITATLKVGDYVVLEDTCTVTVTAEGAVIPTVEEPETSVSDSITEEADKSTATAVAGSVAADKTITSAAQSAANSLNNSSEKDTLIGKGKTELSPSEGQEVTLYTQTYLNIEATELTKTDSTVTSITLDITPMMQVVASTATNSADVELGETGKNAVVVKEAAPLTIRNASEITVTLPSNFARQPVYVKHQASNGGTYFYQATADSTGKVTFTSTHGFSPFTFSLTNEAVAEVNGVGYDNFQAAVDAAEDGQTVTVFQNENLTATISGSSKTITVENKTGSEISVSINGETFQVANNATHEYIYTRPSSGDGSSGSTRYTVSVEDADHGTVKVSPTRASKGSTVTITIKPDEGYELDKLVVTDKNGDSVKLTDKGDGKYTFKMPSSKVTVEATFVEIGTEPETPVFTDVSTSAYYYDAVMWAVENGVTEGTSATTFSPDMACTRAQMVTFLWRAAGSPKPTTTNNPFTDVQSGEYYYDAVLWAVENGVTEGTSATTFSPDAVCTRAQTVTFLWRQAGAPVVNYAISFTDVDANAYYAEAVRWAVSEGVTVGTSDTTFSPDMDCTRAQIVTFMYRAAQ